MEAEVGLNLFACGSFLSEFAQDTGHGHVGFGVGGIEAGGFAQFGEGLVKTMEVSKHDSELEVRLGEVRGEANRLAKILLGVGQLI